MLTARWSADATTTFTHRLTTGDSCTKSATGAGAKCTRLLTWNSGHPPNCSPETQSWASMLCLFLLRPLQLLMPLQLRAGSVHFLTSRYQDEALAQHGVRGSGLAVVGNWAAAVRLQHMGQIK
ncbi:hypothetical protein Vafri_911 [Volvox africanus]|nr:hypothetical protein Vafri_911 [Volvox africanus]